VWPLLLVVACTPADDDPSTPTATVPEPSSPSLTLRDLPLPEVPLLMAHNAMASANDDYLAPNQILHFEEQLALGVRGFMLDVHDEGEGPELCHSQCSLGRAPLVDGLARFEAWLSDHPEEVIVFVLQDEVDPPPILDAFAASGLDAYVMTPPAAGEAWPSPRALAEAGTRLLVTTERAHADAPAWYAPAYDHAFDNDYAAASIDDFDCEVLRGEAGAPFQLLNHFLTSPIALPELAEEANTFEALMAHVDACETAHGQPVSWLAVDFVSIGDGMSVLAELESRRTP